MAGVRFADRVEAPPRSQTTWSRSVHAEEATGLGEPPRDLEILSARRGIAARMVVPDEERARADCDGRLEDLARVHERRRRRSDRDDRVRDRAVSTVEVERDEVLARVVVDAPPEVPRGLRRARDLLGHAPARADVANRDLPNHVNVFRARHRPCLRVRARSGPALSAATESRPDGPEAAPAWSQATRQSA